MDLSHWELVQEFTVEQVACLWVGEEPRSVLRYPFPGQRPEPHGILQALTGAIQRGELRVDSSQNPYRGKGNFRLSKVTRDDLRTFAESKGQRPAFLFDTLLSEDPDPGKSKGGRPREYDWDAFTIEIIRIANTPDGLPERQAVLIEQMLEWCREKWGREPAESSVKAKISSIYNALH